MDLRNRVHRWTAAALASAVLGVVPVVVLGAATSTPAGASTVVASPSTLSFGNVTLGDFTEMPFTLTNTGATSITTGGIFTMGGDGSDFSTSPETDCTSVDSSGAITMAPGDVCTIDVVFAPGVLGTRNTVLILEDSGGFTADFVDVTGTGTIGYYQVDEYPATWPTRATPPTTATPRQPHPQRADRGHHPDGQQRRLLAGGRRRRQFLLRRRRLLRFRRQPSRSTSRSSARPPRGDAKGPYWMVASDGGIFSYGDAAFYGSTGSTWRSTSRSSAWPPTPDGRGYWLVASDGGIFAYGDAGFYGSTGSLTLNKPIVGMAAHPRRTWLLAGRLDGGVFAFGDAGFYGSTGAIHLNQPIVAMAAMPTGSGYWFSAADGGLFNYGDAPFFGSGVGLGLGPIVDHGHQRRTDVAGLR